MGMALGGTGEMADEIANCNTISRITANPADRWGRKVRESRPVQNLLTSYAAQPRTKVTITSCSGVVEELECEAGNEEDKTRVFSCAVPVLSMLDLPG
jgi:hypothetical protein